MHLFSAGKSTRPIPAAGAGFNPDQTCRGVHHVCEQLPAAEALLLNKVAFLAQANQVEYRLADVDAENMYCHGRILLCSPSSCHRSDFEGGGPSHYPTLVEELCTPRTFVW